jgi:hypothetical protein
MIKYINIQALVLILKSCLMADESNEEGLAKGQLQRQSLRQSGKNSSAGETNEDDLGRS